MYDSDGEPGPKIPTQVQSLVEGSGAVLVSENKPVPEVDYLQVWYHSHASGKTTFKICEHIIGQSY